MSGIKTNIKDLGKAAQKFTAAMLAEDERKRAYIKERRFYYAQKHFSPWMQTKLAEEDYRIIHKQ
jgi:hypothetical protein